MAEQHLQGIAVLVLLGIAAQWIAWRMRLPSILLLLVFGFFSGPSFLGLLDPTALLGRDLLLAVVSASAAVILFEGGLSLGLKELGSSRGVVFRLVTVGLAVTGVLASLLAHYVMGLPLGISILLGAILTVSGPTVVMPLLRHVKPHGAVGTILKWEGIVIDPIGAILAVIVFEGLLAAGLRDAAQHAVQSVLMTVAVGGVLGAAGAFLLIKVIRHYWLPDYLHNPVTLAVVLAAFAGSNALQEDSGLLTVTVLGVILANAADVSVRHILEFKENLRTLLISSVFILLAADLEPAQFAGLPLTAGWFVAALILVVRPLSVWASTAGSSLEVRERIFLAWMFPRGIVAAAVASVFALRLQEAGFPGAEHLVPLTFLVIVSTVVVYGLTASFVARRLGLATPNPQGILFVGAHAWAREMAASLNEAGFSVLLVDSNRNNIKEARLRGLRTWYGSAVSDWAIEEMDLTGIGRLFAMTPNDEVNTLTALHYVHEFGRDRVYQLPPAGSDRPRDESAPKEMRGRTLFAQDASFARLASRFGRGARIKATALTEQFGWEDLQKEQDGRGLPLFLLQDKGQLKIATVDQPLKPLPGHTVFSLLDPPAEDTEAPEKSGAGGNETSG